MWLRRIDPGLLQMREACKAMLGLLLTIILTMGLGKLPAVIAGMVVVTVALCHEGVTRRQQLISMLLAWGALFAALLLGNVFRTMPWLAHCVLVIIVFVAFYMQRFGPRYRFFPLLAAIIFLLVIALHLPGPVDGVAIMSAAAIAGVVGVVVQLVIGNGAAQLKARHYHYVLQEQSQSAIAALAGLSAAPCYDQAQVRAIKPALDDIHNSLREIYVLLPSIGVSDAHTNKLRDWLSAQYAFYSALSMLWESVLQMAKVNIDIVPARAKALHEALLAWQDPTVYADALQQLQTEVFAKKAPVTRYFIYWSNAVFACRNMSAERDRVDGLLNEARQLKQEALS